MRYVSSQTDQPVRFVGLSTALANASDVAAWLGIGKIGLFNFKPAVRPVPCSVHIQGFPQKHYCPRMNAMNKPVFEALLTHASPDLSAEDMQTPPEILNGVYSTCTFSSSFSSSSSSSSSFSSSFSSASSSAGPRRFSPIALRPSLVFVSSRRQTRRTAQELVSLLHTRHEHATDLFLDVRPEEADEFSQTVESVQDASLRTTLHHGVAIHHAGLSPHDRAVSARLFEKGFVRVLVATATLAWGMNLPARLVVVKGTEYYDAETNRYKDFPITDLLQMIGRAGRPQFDSQAVAVIFCHEPKKNFYKRFLYQPFPVESCLLNVLAEHLNAEIVGGTIQTKQQAIEYLTWTYFFRRLTSNPSYYDPSLMIQDFTSSFASRGDRLQASAVRQRRAAIAAFVDKAVCEALDELLEASALRLRFPTAEEKSQAVTGGDATQADAVTRRLRHSADADEQDGEQDEEERGQEARAIRAELSALSEEKKPARRGRGRKTCEGRDIFEEEDDGPTSLEPVLESTPLGRIACVNYISPKSAKMLSDALRPAQAEDENRRLSFVDIVKLLADVPEYKQMPVRHNEDNLNADFSAICPYPIDASTVNSPHTKTFLLFQAQMFQLPVPIADYNTDLKSALDNAMRILQAMLDICTEEAQLRYALDVILLFQCLIQATHPARSSLRALKHLRSAEPSRLRRLSCLGIHSLPFLVEHKCPAAVLLKAGFTDKHTHEICEELKKFPRLRVSTRLFVKEAEGASDDEAVFEHSPPQPLRQGDGREGETLVHTVRPGADLHLEVSLKYSNLPPQVAFTPNFHKQKTAGWFLLLGDADEDVDELIALRRVHLHSGKTQASFEFSAPDVGGASFLLTLFVCSDTYFGLDQEIELCIRTEATGDIDEAPREI
ncbi:putative activating signal cointegrator 1 complex subunit 3 [Toxoplasma gondii VAND]|uniref:Putative activating signal cointegrator 1 complex subunit 3 n=1 Tax=Toxoplasma gondii VAND TaxID=933077 RepID=A0A086QH36_TOXGO|nr:putative activating signal cointegrator 1 complex subunit 3 [Toxoplasma gondii VAND]